MLSLVTMAHSHLWIWRILAPLLSVHNSHRAEMEEKICELGRRNSPTMRNQNKLLLQIHPKHTQSTNFIFIASLWWRVSERMIVCVCIVRKRCEKVKVFFMRNVWQSSFRVSVVNEKKTHKHTKHACLYTHTHSHIVYCIKTHFEKKRQKKNQTNSSTRYR